MEYYEKGLRLPDVCVLAKIADFYDVSADYLLGRSDVMNIDADKQINAACHYTGLSESSIKELHDSLTTPDGNETISTIAFKALENDNAYFCYYYVYSKNIGKCINDFLSKKDGQELLMLIDEYIYLTKTDSVNDLNSILLALQFEIIERLKHWRETKYHITLNLDELLK